MKYYLIAGEASGDLHGANLMRELGTKDSNADFRCWGGDRMQEAGATLVKHYRDLAFMGFTEVLMNLGTILGNLRFCKKDILRFQPDAIILIDYPGFNLRIAGWAHRQGFRVFYYISPQVWAWKKSRVYKIKKYVDRMFVILPFEKEFYRNYGYVVDFVGHPLLDAIQKYRQQEGAAGRTSGMPLTDKPVIALLPGSRAQEIRKVLPVMLETVSLFPHMQAVIAGLSTVDPELYKVTGMQEHALLVTDQTYALLSRAHAAIVTSGTASLETALFNVPQVIAYRGGSISYAIARRVVKIRYIGLPNLIMDKPVVTELIQHDLNSERLGRELQSIIDDGELRSRIISDYARLAEILGGPGASGRAAELILGYLG